MELFGQRRTVVTVHFAAREPGGKFPAVDVGSPVLPSACVLQHFLLQLAALAHQVA